MLIYCRKIRRLFCFRLIYPFGRYHTGAGSRDLEKISMRILSPSLFAQLIYSFG